MKQNELFIHHNGPRIVLPVAFSVMTAMSKAAFMTSAPKFTLVYIL